MRLSRWSTIALCTGTFQRQLPHFGKAQDAGKRRRLREICGPPIPALRPLSGNNSHDTHTSIRRVGLWLLIVGPVTAHDWYALDYCKAECVDSPAAPQETYDYTFKYGAIDRGLTAARNRRLTSQICISTASVSRFAFVSRRHRWSPL